MKKLIKKIILGIIPKLQETEYDYIYSSRRVIKNEDINKNANNFYDEDIWKLAHGQIIPFLSKGVSMYYEIIGFLPNGTMIQKDYDYGYTNPLELWERDFIIENQGESGYLNCYLEGRDGKKSFGIYIYRITQTNVDGKVYEFSAKQVQDFCKSKGLNAVPELYYGKASGLFDKYIDNSFRNYDDDLSFEENFLDVIKAKYNEKDCYMCSNKVPEEGVVVRIEGLDCEAYKQKSTAFYERETKLLDKGESNIEDEN